MFDTLIEDLAADRFPDRPWGPGNNPKTAVWDYLKTHPEFEIDQSIQHKLLITVAPDGYLQRVIDGHLPPKQLKMVQVWIEIHQEDLLIDWELAANGEKPFRIAPLQ